MKTDKTTIPTEGAVWTEQELFQHFLTMTLKDYDAFGKIEYEYVAMSRLEDPGVYGSLEDIYERIADDLSDNNEPEARLEYLIADLGDYLYGLRKLHAAFGSLKEDHIILPLEPEETAEHAVWDKWSRARSDAENDPKFRPLEIHGTQPAGAA